MATDKRYTITKEYCGLPYPAFVVRFCGDWIAARDTREQAVAVITEHKLNFWNHSNDES